MILTKSAGFAAGLGLEVQVRTETSFIEASSKTEKEVAVAMMQASIKQREVRRLEMYMNMVEHEKG
jgi:hypothetical protein